MYTEDERARAYIVFATNNGNMRRTSRDTAIPVSTLHKWAADWDINPPDVADIEAAAGDFLDSAKRVRDAALLELERKLPKATASALVATVGMLQDKISIASGLATSRQETVHTLPPAEDIANVLGAALQAALSAARERDTEIIDAGVVRELSPVSTAE